MGTNQCEKCGYEWVSRVKEPKACPKCKSYSWNKEKKNSTQLKGGKEEKNG